MKRRETQPRYYPEIFNRLANDPAAVEKQIAAMVPSRGRLLDNYLFEAPVPTAFRALTEDEKALADKLPAYDVNYMRVRYKLDPAQFNVDAPLPAIPANTIMAALRRLWKSLERWPRM